MPLRASLQQQNSVWQHSVERSLNYSELFTGQACCYVVEEDMVILSLQYYFFGYSDGNAMGRVCCPKLDVH